MYQQIGGIDQTINVHCGHDFIRRLTEKQTYGLFVPILANEKGTKFGKSEGNSVYLNEDKTSPYNLYQVMSPTIDFLIQFNFKTIVENN